MTDLCYEARQERQAQREQERAFREEVYRDTLRALENACTLLDRAYRSWVDGKIDPILDMLDGEIYDFLQAYHPDYAPEGA